MPECITTNAQGNKNIELPRLKEDPVAAQKLIAYVKGETRKNRLREVRRERDVARRAKKKRDKEVLDGRIDGKQWAGQGAIGPDGQFVNTAAPAKQAPAGLAAPPGMPGA